jgi:hypothetical protein
MSAKRVSIGPRPAVNPSAEAWVGVESRVASPAAKTLLYTARLTIDVTPQMRARIKVAAFQSGITVAELVRRLLEHEFPNDQPAAAP